MPDAILKIKCLHDCKRVEKVMKNEDGFPPCKTQIGKTLLFITLNLTNQLNIKQKKNCLPYVFI